METVTKPNQIDADSSSQSSERKNDEDQQKTTFKELKELNETITVFGLDVEDCEYLVITSNKNNPPYTTTYKAGKF